MDGRPINVLPKQQDILLRAQKNAYIYRGVHKEVKIKHERDVGGEFPPSLNRTDTK